MTLSELTIPIKEDLKKFNSFFDKQLSTKVSLLNLVLKYITAKKGKQMRPIMVLLSAKLCGSISERTYIAASLVELLHTATLVHDDVVDGASERRGIASINATWNNKIAVLIGDFLLSKGLLVSVENKEFGFLEVTSTAVRRMSEGELLAIDKTKRWDLDEDRYFQVIKDKTASLISTCCEIGAMSATNKQEEMLALRDYGENIGIAFQLRDDIFDYTAKSSLIGKPVGNDIKEKKITLPLLYTLKQNPHESEKIIKMIKKGKLKSADINYIIEFVINSGGIKYAEDQAKHFVNEAKNNLSIFPDSMEKKSLIDFADFVYERKS
ncbi:MAG TPA: polyprenyl synthetase family protein [Candidatus Kapabacteria bacterium]|nr:polyprenyl synthetase family protein [Candidatus Kapabacteria bacterium]